MPLLRLLSATAGVLIAQVSCRDGLERVTIDAGGTVGTLRQQLSSALNLPRDHVTLSKDQKLVGMTWTDN